jgi:MobA/VirD2-like, nuclease domain
MHTDEPHPHVHLVLKAVNEQGERLNIRKATLREWRREFARHLRDQGIAANATERAVRGESRTHKMDGIYRATLRGDSTHIRARTQAALSELRTGNLRPEIGRTQLVETRRTVERGWRLLSEILTAQGQHHLSVLVNRFVDSFSPPATENQQLAAKLSSRQRADSANERCIAR